MTQTTFRDYEQPASEDQLATFEKQLGMQIPAEFREFLQQHNVSRPKPMDFNDANGKAVSIDYFLGVEAVEETHNLTYAINMLV